MKFIKKGEADEAVDDGTQEWIFEVTVGQSNYTRALLLYENSNFSS